MTITFSEHAARDFIEDFGDSVLSSSWYTAVGAEYGVAAGDHVMKARIGPVPPALDRAAIGELVDDWIGNRVLPEPPQVGNQLLYMLYVPPTVQRLGDLARATTYHEMRQYKDARFPLVVVLDDGGPRAAMTVAAAHELLNTVANPYSQPDDGYYVDPPSIDPWSLVPGEVADLCEGESPFYENGLALPRIYSDASARTNTTPCKPAGHDEVWSAVSAEPSTMTLVRRGESAVFRITGWSTHDVPAWSLGVRVAEFSMLSHAQMRPTLNATEIRNGGTAELTLRVPDDAPLGAIGGVYVLSGVHARRWPVGIIVTSR